MDEKPTPLRKRRSPSDARIVAAARRLFLARGLDGVNMDLIASEAGVARQTLYNRFGSKDAVFKAAIKEHWHELGHAADTTLDPESPPRAVLDEVALRILAFVKDRQQIAMTRMIIAESIRQPSVAEAFFSLGKEPLLARFIAYISHARNTGWLSCPDPDLAARQFLGMIQESLLWPQVMGVGQQPDESSVIEGAIEVFLKAYGGDTQGYM